jgi:signal transduction histidine kinase
LTYTSNQLRLLVRDNGCGIDPAILQAGREGHWGLSGMRERADRIRARFCVMSSASAGTEIELSVPGNVAFQGEPSPNSARVPASSRAARLAMHPRPFPAQATSLR